MHHRLKGLAHLVAISLVTAFVISSAYLAGFVTQRIAETEARQLQTSDTRPFDVFWEAWEILHREFYGPLPDSNDTVYAAIQGAIDTLGDPYTAFANPRQAQLFEDSLNGGFEGIGATVEKRDGRIVIVAPLPNTPAERAGLRAGDVVLSVDGKSLLDVDLWEAIVRIRGPRGTSVTLTLLRSGQSDPIDVTLQRDRIEVPTVESRVIHQDGVTIAYVKLLRFASNAPRQFRDEIRRLMDENPQGVILDLRDNPGGYLYVAVRIASEFIDEGLILTEQGKDGQRPHPAEPGGLLSGSNALPLAVLVNKGSASASEIVAGAIQDHHRGVLIGETTFGKGSVQVSHHLSDGSTLRVTTARWLTPNGRLIHELGLEPDIVVPQTDGQAEAGPAVQPDPSLSTGLSTGSQQPLDPQLDRAVEYLVEQLQPDSPTNLQRH